MNENNKTFKVLVFPCGSQPAVDINFALRYSMRVELFGASSVEDHGKYVYRNYIGGLPKITDHPFLNEFNRVLQEHNIDFVIPTHDSVALFLMENQDRLHSRIIASDLETVRICRSKSMTYERFKQYAFIPKVYMHSQEVPDYPVFVKPDDSQGGKGAQLVPNKQELDFLMKKNPNLLICEYLPGDELSVDCFTDRHGNLAVVSPRSRDRTLAGMSVHSKLVAASPEIEEIAALLNQHLSFRGYWFFQVKKDRMAQYKLLEISSRFAGTACINIGRDLNLPLLSILDFAGIDVEIQANEYRVEMDRALVNRYRLDLEYDRVYVDLDDTLIINRKTNPYLLMFLFQCINQDKHIILITKHRHDVCQTLLAYKLNRSLFTEIIHLKRDDHKYKYMSNDIPSIFIDNSFAERMEVRLRLGIPSFDVASIEGLIDWKG